jgi:CubicO group peptidase (beta-lactamase class C family)
MRRPALRVCFASFSIVLILFISLPSWAVRPDDIDLIMEDAISEGLVAGGVVLIGDSKGILYQRAYGRTSPSIDAPPVEVNTVFDVASLTKVIVTTSAVMKLAEEGKISLVDPVKKWFPEFKNKGKDDLLILNLLTHTSGFHDFPLGSSQPLTSAIMGAANQALSGEPGTRFNYADINFILLGELVHRVSGETLDLYSESNFFVPLGMHDTGFNPDPQATWRYASTIADGGLLMGRVQDYSARQLGGVAGHAGLFTTSTDLARFCQMILNGGKLDGHRVLSERAVRQMTAPYFSRNGKVVRGLGWDRESPYSAPRGAGFSETSFGHTGYSGTSIWIDPESDLFVVVLTARLNFKNVSMFNRLRSDISTITASLFAPSVEMAGDGRYVYDSRL